ISVQKQPESKDLTESVTFSQRIQKEKMERIFYYSNYTELRSRFSSYLERDTHVEGEVTNEFERTC
ncbi:MAG TPA: single-stranded-DNA-specific exonuclease C-terminal domain-containing protein, partial [Bacillota bacterium]|nr:single-stranded-DNA-specific exonuclease C-terminal domain-containing protein [Bacillota bacterium]